MVMVEQIKFSFSASQLAYLFIGLIVLFALWLALVYWLPPKLAFSKHIRSRAVIKNHGSHDDKPSIVYEIKMENAGRRPIIDIQGRAYIRFYGISTSSVCQIVHLVMTNGGTVFGIPILMPFRKTYAHTVVHFGIDFSQIQLNRFRAELREKILNKTLLIEDFLSNGLEHQVCFVVSGIDQFSGAKKTFIKTYSFANIIQTPLVPVKRHLKSTDLRPASAVASIGVL
jgi:hypothetical protein